ncbi:hypothetical protein LZ554_001701 [Drepanopeziza brunnea f. sp. 'monogermtubi']|nr:hypothetical protein LZ554_001701 [Drepanopeziza brunnea f. sp. 'monogermtubi']
MCFTPAYLCCPLHQPNDKYRPLDFRWAIEVEMHDGHKSENCFCTTADDKIWYRVKDGYAIASLFVRQAHI